MREENITLEIIFWLKERGWIINCFDYPQSGTGYCLRPKNPIPGNKNKGNIIPDIVASRGDTSIFFENKVNFFPADLDALSLLRNSGEYQAAMSDLLNRDVLSVRCLFGVGLYDSDSNERKLSIASKELDFALLVSSTKQVRSFLHGFDF